jgi:hypothetical protein
VLSYAENPRWGASDAVAWVDSGDRAVVLDLVDGLAAPKALEQSGALIWFAVAEGGPAGEGLTTDEIVVQVAAEAEVDIDVVRDDVIAFLSELLERGWIAPRTD